MKHLALAAFLAGACVTSAATLSHYEVFASTTEPGIYPSYDKVYHAFIPQTLDLQNPLVVFLPGSSAEPRSYTNFMVTAAQLRYRTIGVGYLNAPLMEQGCTNTPFDCDCQGPARFEVAYGADVSPVVTCDFANSIQNRIVKFLEWLEANHPGEGWSRYIAGIRPDWTNIILAGHSQGGVMTSYIAKNDLVLRAAMFSNEDWCDGPGRPPNWVDDPGVTPIERCFAFVHSLDELAVSNKIVPNWTQYGLLDYGPIRFVEDTPGAPFDGTHALMTALLPESTGSISRHDAPVVDSATPYQDGVPIYKPVWEFFINDWDSGQSFDGDDAADIGVYHAKSGQWYFLHSSDPFATVQFGYKGGDPVERDYDGDGRLDLGVFDPKRGRWSLLRSKAGFTNTTFGSHGMEPVSADYDGDRKADIAVYHPNSGTWYLLQSRDGYKTVQFGYRSAKPVPGDYDGDGRADLAVYDDKNGMWYLLRTTKGYTNIQFGYRGAVPVPGDYDNDGKEDIGVYDARTGQWYLRRTLHGVTNFQFGFRNTVAVNRDYDADGRADPGVFDPRTDTWYLRQSTDGYRVQQFGYGSVVPLGTPPQ
jgi:hypothetical protein